MSLNQSKVIKWSFRGTLCFFVHDENRKGGGGGGEHNPWEVDVVLCLDLDSHGSVITPLIYSEHEITDCDRRCCQNIKHTVGGGGGGHVYSCLFYAVGKWCRGMVQFSINIMNLLVRTSHTQSRPPPHPPFSEHGEKECVVFTEPWKYSSYLKALIMMV